MNEPTFTTHDIARFCGVYPSSVVNWINNGKLKSFQTVGGHHRVTKDVLLDFMRQLGVPIPPEVVGRASVLVVDDDEEFLRVITRAFSRYADRYDVECCADGVDALIRIGQSPPVLVILDMVMPKMDGLQVCKVLKAKEETRGIRIIAVSGKKLAVGEKRLEEMGVDAFFRKPVEIGELLAKAAELMAGSGRTQPTRR
jgi:two-component system OmpR family response regulator